MWVLFVCIILALSLSLESQHQQSQCVHLFDNGYRKCFLEFGGFQLETVYSLVNNGSSGYSGPTKTIPNKPNSVVTLCRNRLAITNCISSLSSSAHPSCRQTEIDMMDGTVTLARTGIKDVCGVALVQPQRFQCYQLLSQGYEKCFREFGGFELDTVYSLINNGNSGSVPTKAKPSKPSSVVTLCRNRLAITNCISSALSLQSPDPSCRKIDVDRINGTIASVMTGLEGVCGGAHKGEVKMSRVSIPDTELDKQNTTLPNDTVTLIQHSFESQSNHPSSGDRGTEAESNVFSDGRKRVVEKPITTGQT